MKENWPYMVGFLIGFTATIIANFVYRKPKTIIHRQPETYLDLSHDLGHDRNAAIPFNYIMEFGYNYNRQEIRHYEIYGKNVSTGEYLAILKSVHIQKK